MLDYKKAQKDLYQPKTIPSVVQVPEMTFIMTDGEGDPNTSEAYQSAIELLYGLSYAIKMSKKGETAPDGYFEYVVPPLEGLWWTRGESFDIASFNKAAFCWTAMIRQPEFVTLEVFEAASLTLAKKKPKLDCSRARLEAFSEGLCAQIMHVGSYDDEPASIARLNQFIMESGHRTDFGEKRRHHEIYLGDPRKTAAEKLKTVIRLPIA